MCGREREQRTLRRGTRMRSRIRTIKARLFENGFVNVKNHCIWKRKPFSVIMKIVTLQKTAER